jgi:hypothetical protein
LGGCFHFFLLLLSLLLELAMVTYSTRFSSCGGMSLRPFSYLDGQTDELLTCGSKAHHFLKNFLFEGSIFLINVFLTLNVECISFDGRFKWPPLNTLFSAFHYIHCELDHYYVTMPLCPFHLLWTGPILFCICCIRCELDLNFFGCSLSLFW